MNEQQEIVPNPFKLQLPSAAGDDQSELSLFFFLFLFFFSRNITHGNSERNRERIDVVTSHSYIVKSIIGIEEISSSLKNTRALEKERRRRSVLASEKG